MCIITDPNHVVKSVSLIPGVSLCLLKGWHVYFPWSGEIPVEGDVFDHPEFNEIETIT